jgi:sulfoxide reductase heme-binding subunit YedZ
MADRRMSLLKAGVFAGALVPAGVLLWRTLSDDLGANPIEAITHATGDWTLRFLLITLAVTPVRRLTGWSRVAMLRRMLGLFAFFYASLHFATYIVLDQFFALDAIVADVGKRPYITVGFTAFVLLAPLAVTSTAGWTRRLGGARWRALHRLVYVSAICGVVHYLWLVKADVRRPLTYGAILAVLLAVRLWWAVRGRAGAGAVAPVRAVEPPARL